MNAVEAVYEYFYDNKTAGQKAKFYIYVIQTLIGDGFMVWCFVLHCKLELTLSHSSCIAC